MGGSALCHQGKEDPPGLPLPVEVSPGSKLPTSPPPLRFRSLGEPSWVLWYPQPTGHPPHHSYPFHSRGCTFSDHPWQCPPLLKLNNEHWGHKDCSAAAHQLCRRAGCGACSFPPTAPFRTPSIPHPRPRILKTAPSGSAARPLDQQCLF